MIGPAEIEEMANEYAEAVARFEHERAGWPLFIVDEHLDGADRDLIGSFAEWLRSATASGAARET